MILTTPATNGTGLVRNRGIETEIRCDGNLPTINARLESLHERQRSLVNFESVAITDIHRLIGNGGSNRNVESHDGSEIARCIASTGGIYRSEIREQRTLSGIGQDRYRPPNRSDPSQSIPAGDPYSSRRLHDAEPIAATTSLAATATVAVVLANSVTTATSLAIRPDGSYV